MGHGLDCRMEDVARTGPGIVKRAISFGERQRLGGGGPERKPAALETCSTHARETGECPWPVLPRNSPTARTLPS